MFGALTMADSIATGAGEQDVPCWVAMDSTVIACDTSTATSEGIVLVEFPVCGVPMMDLSGVSRASSTVGVADCTDGAGVRTGTADSPDSSA